MYRKFGQTAVIIVSLCVLMVAGGCSRKGRMGDSIAPEELEGDVALGERFEDGERITDVQFANVLFDFDSFQIRGSEVGKIEGVADYMKGNSRVRLVAEGHCDERGSREYNMSLGEHRSLAVRAYLVKLGIDGSKIQTRSYGEERPVDPGHSEEAWRLNRRVEFVLYR